MPRFEHGKSPLRWCDQDQILILGSRCDICGSRGREFRISLPGDIRPCLGESLPLVKRLLREKFGAEGVLEGRLVFLNKTSGEDRTDEIVVGGHVLGVLRFDVKKGDFALDIRLEGALAIQPLAKKGIVVIEHQAGHLKGKSVAGAEIKDIKGEFEEGDPLIVLAGNLVCAGVAKTSSSQARSSEKALGIRDVGRGTLNLGEKTASWNDFVDGNIEHLRELESRGVSDIKSFAGNNRLPVTLSFSGGKDSLAAFGLAEKAIRDLTLIFINTGLEFPETVAYVDDFARRSGVKLIKADAGRAFWEQVDTFGPPAKDFRWCCKVCKLAPVTSLIEEHFPQGTITVEGNRSFESFARSKIGFVERNPFVPNQVILNPIKDWKAIEVWAYIWWRSLPYNPLYDEDFERIGCYLCPSCLQSEWKTTSSLHPDIYREWEDYLNMWASRNKAGSDFIKYGFWRWKVLPPKMRRLAEEMHLPLPEARSDRIDLKWVKGISPCLVGGYSLEGILALPRKHDFSQVAEALKTVGKVKFSKDYEIALVKDKDATLKVFGGGQIVATAPTAEKAQALFERGAKALLRSQLCSRCGICVRNCSKHAISIKEGIKVDEERCNRCGKCAEACVVAHYYDKLVS